MYINYGQGNELLLETIADGSRTEIVSLRVGSYTIDHKKADDKKAMTFFHLPFFLNFRIEKVN